MAAYSVESVTEAEGLRYVALNVSFEGFEAMQIIVSKFSGDALGKQLQAYADEYEQAYREVES